MTASLIESDEALVAQVLAGDEDAFIPLMARYQRSLLRLARNYVRDAALAEDVVQDTWMGFLRGIEKFEGRSTFKTWLFRVLANRAKSRAVKEARYVPMADEGDPAPDGDAFDPAGGWRVPPREWKVTPERLLLSTELLDLVHEALSGLPSSQRTVVSLRDLEDLDADEVCNILGISETNQRVLLHRGRTKLRAALAARLES
ncbi:MAG: RNA polymerase sigma factor [Acidobacteria bacterium]|nr:RNA polymerase sigma factor [Acidobacteriota bacterium]